MDYTKSLETFGFSKNEATVYLALLELGLTNIGPLVKKSGLHRQLVYECLANLERRGYVTSVTKNNRKHVQAASPTNIVSQLETKIASAQAIIPDLVALQSHVIDAVEVRTLYGQKEFMRNLKELVESAERNDHIMRILGGGKDIDFYAILGDQYRTYVQLVKQHNIKKQLLAPENFSEEFKKKFASEDGSELRLMNSGLSSPTYTRMTQEMISIEIYIPNHDVTIIQIRNRAIANAYIENFELLWKQAVVFNNK